MKNILLDSNPGPRISVVGQGRFGAPLAKYLDPVSPKCVYGVDKNVNSDGKMKRTLPEVVDIVAEQNPTVLVLAISLENQASEGVAMLRTLLMQPSSKISAVWQINSVQSVMHNAMVKELPNVLEHSRPVALVSLHPNHGPVNFDQENEKVWILTDITVVGGITEAEESEFLKEIQEKTQAEQKEFLENIRKQRKENSCRAAREQIEECLRKVQEKHGSKGKITLIDLTQGYRNEAGKKVLSGPEYHDFIAAYYQAIFHMVKLIPGIQETTWYKNNFQHVTVDDAFSKAFIQNNPYAKVLYDRFCQHLGENFQLTNEHDFEKVFSVVCFFLNEGGEVIPQSLEKMKTPNIQKLEKCARDFYKEKGGDM